ncbi:MAG: hypothetical protein IPJ40_01480 [Saprospirales bacterium]|nr:hypothetical protein [Saprospirales bacterium]
MKATRFFLLLLAGSAIWGCRTDAPPPSSAVYHWESTFAPTPEEQQWLDDQHINRIYLRLFDIDWDESLQEAVPVGVLQVPDSVATQTREIVPTFFLTNRSLEHLTTVQTDTLAMRLLRKARLKLRTQLGNPIVPEWQFDCDWTENARDRYFQFLETMNRELKKRGLSISVTIRLHQVKYYRRTGVPP